MDEGGTDGRVRQAMRDWIRTGKVELPDEPEPDGKGRSFSDLPVDERPSVHVGGGVKVSKRQMDAFTEMGGTMKRRPRRQPAPTPENAETVR